MERHRNRVRRTKKWLRLLPRKAQLEKYPILGKFANTARKSAFLWSFRSQEVIPAFFAGWVVSLMPIMGIQIPVAIVCAFLFRANILILTALQMITNPVTVPIIWPTLYKVGQFVVHLLGNETVTTLNTGSFDSVSHASKWFLRATATTTLGGILMGYCFAFLSCFIYKRFVQYLSKERKLREEYIKGIRQITPPPKRKSN